MAGDENEKFSIEDWLEKRRAGVVSTVPLPEKFSIESWLNDLDETKDNQSSLQKFIALCENFENSKSTNDVIHDLLETTAKTGGYDQLLSLIGKKKSAFELSLIFDILEKILTRIKDSFEEYTSLGNIIVQQICKKCIHNVYWMLGQKKANVVKKTLKLLSVCVLFNEQAAIDILTHLDFQNGSVKMLPTRTDKKDEQDIRLCYIYFVLAFLYTDDDKIISQVLEKPELFRPIFNFLIKDKANVIELFLTTIMDKVFKKKTISKTLKIRLLDEYVICQIAKLYVWDGPQQWEYKKSLKGKEKKTKEVKEKKNNYITLEPIPDEKLIEEQEQVNKIVTQFLLLLFTSFKYGIIFKDETLGAGKNCNYLVTRLLLCIKNPHTSSHTKELFVKILSAVPDQLKFYLNSADYDVVPRDSVHWTNTMMFLTQIYDGQNIGGFLNILTTRTKIKDLVPLLTSLLNPKIITRDIIRDGLKPFFPHVNRTMLIYVNQLAQRLSNFCSMLKDTEKNNWKVLPHSDIPTVIEEVGKSIAKILLEAKEMDELWENMKRSTDANSARSVELGLILDIQTSLKRSFPFMMQNISLDLVDIVVNRKDLVHGLSSDELALFRLKVLEVLLKSEPEKLLCGPIVEIVINMITEPNEIVKRNAADFLRRMFIKSKLFNNLTEIDVWFKLFHLKFKASKKVGKFLIEVIAKLLKNNQNNGLIKDSRFVSCLLKPALEVLSQQDTFVKDANCQKYLTIVLRDICHLEANKDVIEYLSDKKLVLPDNFFKYVKICSLNGGVKKFSEEKILASGNISQDLLLMMSFRNVKCIFMEEEDIKEKMKNLDEFDENRIVYQILFYLDVISSEHNAKEVKFVEYFLKFLKYLIFPSENGIFNKHICTIVLSHPTIKNRFLNEEFESISQLILQFITSVIDHFEETEHFKWYCDQTLIFLESLKDNDKKINSEMKEFITRIFKHIPIADVVRVLEEMPENVIMEFGWLAKLFCERFCDDNSQNQSNILSSDFLEMLLRHRSKKAISSCLKKVINVMPAYIYSFNEGVLKNFLAEDKHSTVKKLGPAFIRNVFFCKEFEDLYKEVDFEDLNNENVIQLLEVYLQNQISLIKDLSEEEQLSITEKLKLMMETLEKRGILSINADTVDIYFNLIALNVKDIKGIRKIITSKILESEDSKDLERIKTLCKICDKKSLWDRLMKKCFSRLENDFQLYLLQSLLLIQEKVKDFSSEYKSLHWEELIKKVLLASLIDGESSEFLEFLLEFLRKYNVYLDASLIGNMIFGHSNFFTIMLSNSEQYCKIKGILLDVLIELATKDRRTINSLHIPLYLSSYNATLDLNDQKILYLLHLYSVHGVNFDEYKPCVWGPPAVNFYSLRKSTSFTLDKMPSVEEVLQNFDKEKLKATALKFPTDLSLTPQISESFIDHSVVDPRFLLPLLSTLLSPTSVVNHSKFLESNVLSVVFASLSSNCPEMRRAAYFVLMLFHEHLENSRFNNKSIWLHLLTALKNGIDVENMKLPNIISIYLAKVTTVLLSVQDPMHEVVAKFLLLKSNLSMKKVPDFYHLFNNSYLEHSEHQKWVLNLLIDGVKDSADYYLCKSQFVNKVVLSFCDSAVCKLRKTIQIVQVLNRFASIPTAARNLITFDGLLPFIHRILAKYGSVNSEILSQAICFINKLWLSVIEAAKLDVSSPKSKVSEVLSRRSLENLFSAAMEFHLICNTCIDLVAANPNTHDWEKLTSTLSSIFDHINTRDDMKFFTNTIANPGQVANFLKIHKTVMEKSNVENQDAGDLHSRVLPASSSTDNLAVNKILLQLSVWTLENESFKTEIPLFCQTCLSAIECNFASTHFKETIQFQMEVFTFIHKLFSIESCASELTQQLTKRTVQNDRILIGLLRCYSNNHFSTLTKQLNSLMQIITTEVSRNYLPEWFARSNEKERESWEKAIDCYNSLCQHKSASSVSTQNSLTTLACEFLLRKTTPHLFDSLVRSSELTRKLRKRSREASGDETKIKAKHKRKSLAPGFD